MWTMAQEMAETVERATAPHQYALSTRAGCECVAHVLLGLTELDPETIVTSLDGIIRHNFEKAMLRGLRQADDGTPLRVHVPREGFDVSCFSRLVWLCCWLCDPPGVGRQALYHQRLPLHVQWLHRRKRDCTPALFLTSSVCTSALTLRTTEEEGLAPLPSSSQCSRSSPEEEGQALLFTVSVCSTEVRSWHRWNAPAMP